MTTCRARSDGRPRCPARYRTERQQRPEGRGPSAGLLRLGQLRDGESREEGEARGGEDEQAPMRPQRVREAPRCHRSGDALQNDGGMNGGVEGGRG